MGESRVVGCSGNWGMGCACPQPGCGGADRMGCGSSELDMLGKLQEVFAQVPRLGMPMGALSDTHQSAHQSPWGHHSS